MKFNLVGQPTKIEMVAGAEGNLLIFDGAILARAEVNKNRDQILPEGIDQLAATIGGRAIDIEHDTSANCGIFTGGLSVDDPNLGRVLSTSGIIWADRYPNEAAGIQAGTHGLSIEADGKYATCSVCGGKFDNVDLYCAHLRNRRESGAVRTVADLTSAGGAVTRRPAGNGTDFAGAAIRFVASHDDHLMTGAWYDKHLPKGETLADLPDSDFADPKGRRFPYKIHGKVIKEGWVAAWSAAHGGHTGEADKSAIAKLKRDKPADVKIESTTEEVHMKLCPYCNAAVVEGACSVNAAHVLTADAMGPDLAAALAKLQTLGAEKEKLEAQIAEANTTLASKSEEVIQSQEKVTELTTSLTAAEEKVAATTASLRRQKLARMTDAEWDKRKPTLLAMTDDAFDLTVELATAPAAPGGIRLDAETAGNNNNGHVQIELG